MNEVFVIRNQLGHYWAKSKSWVDGSEARTVMRSKHEDEAINTLFELSSKDIELRGEIVRVEVTERGEPIIEPSQIPLLADEQEQESAAPGDSPDAEQAATAGENGMGAAPSADQTAPQPH